MFRWRPRSVTPLQADIENELARKEIEEGNNEEEREGERQQEDDRSDKVQEILKKSITPLLAFTDPNDTESYDRRKHKSRPIHGPLFLLYICSMVFVEFLCLRSMDKFHDYVILWQLAVSCFFLSTAIILVVRLVRANSPTRVSDELIVSPSLKSCLWEAIARHVYIFHICFVALKVIGMTSLLYVDFSLPKEDATEINPLIMLVSGNIFIIPILMQNHNRYLRYLIIFSALPLLTFILLNFARHANTDVVVIEVVSLLYFMALLYEQQYSHMVSFIMSKHAREKKNEDWIHKNADVDRKMNTAMLNQILPQSVSDTLKSGEMAEPELFDNVTVFFSDVENFTAICAQCSPKQVWDLLNDLYTVMDLCTEKYKTLYKVETIGDAYMVCSGAPVRGNIVPRDIADFSLLVRAACLLVKSPADGHPIQIRIGLHTGPVMGGVVGTLMPRYCLFGDTVNVASRMETTGAVGGVHCSEETAAILMGTGDYILSDRGKMYIKGKGFMRTFWLERAAPHNTRSDKKSIEKILNNVEYMFLKKRNYDFDHIYTDENGKDETSQQETPLSTRDTKDLSLSPTSSPKGVGTFGKVPYSPSSPKSYSPGSPGHAHTHLDLLSDTTHLKGLVVMKEGVQRKLCQKKFLDADPNWTIESASSGEEGLKKLRTNNFFFDFVVISGDADFFSLTERDNNRELNEQEMVYGMRNSFQKNSCVVIAVGGNSVLRNQSLKEMGIDVMWNRPIKFTPNEIRMKVLALHHNRRKNQPKFDTIGNTIGNVAASDRAR